MSETIKRKPVQSQDNIGVDDDEFLKNLASRVNTALKTDSLMVGDQSGDEGVPYWIRTGIPPLDYAIGGVCHPGIPGSRIIEAHGGADRFSRRLGIRSW